MDALVDYRLGSSAAERDRLLAQCELFRASATHMLDRIDLPDAARALDVGCGPLGVLDLLSRKVGETGSVTGLDTDPRMITWARQAVIEYDLGDVGLLHGPLSPQVVPDASYDLVHCRLVLVNNTMPERLLTAMTAATRPGGWVAAQEVDWSTWSCDPPHPAWDELKTRMAPVFGGDVHIGGRLPALLAAAGLRDVHTAHHTFRWRRGDRYQTLLLHFADLFTERILHSGDLSAARLHALTAGLAEHLDRPGTTVQESLFVQAWGRRPGAEAP